MPTFVLMAAILAAGCTALAYGLGLEVGGGSLTSLLRVLAGLGIAGATLAALAWACRRLAVPATRMLVTGGAFLVVVLLLFLQNKAMVGRQELQAEISGSGTEFTVGLKDLAGTPVPAGEAEIEQLVNRLRGAGGADEIPLAKPPAPAAEGRVAIALAPGRADEAALRGRLTGKPFHRPNPARDLLHVNRGIDLRGGVEFICRLYDDEAQPVKADADVLSVLRGRLDSRGLTEPTVTRMSEGDVQIVIPGGTPADAARTRKVIEQTGRLEFREVLKVYQPVGDIGPGTEQFDLQELGGGGTARAVRKPNGSYDLAGRHGRSKNILAVHKSRDASAVPERFYLLGPPQLTGKDVKDAQRTIHQGQDAVAITFNAVGGAKNYEFTNRLYLARQSHIAAGGRADDAAIGHLAILFDGKIESAPVVESPSTTNCVISGSFTPEEIDSLKSALKGGALNVTPVVLSERVVGATLGAETVRKAVTAMLWSFAGILAFMAIYYRRLGVGAIVNMLVTGGLTWATLSVFGATMTLPGLAGLVLSVAMSMDTNVLVYERIREELRQGKDLRTAVDLGYERAFLAILDSNLTTIFSGIVLYAIGSGSVKGFGLTLAVGVAVSMFSGVYIGRLITDFFTRGRQTVSMASLVPELRLPYVRWRKVSYALSIVTAVVGVGWFAFGHLFTGGSFSRNFDIDFTGGNLVQVTFKEPLAPSDVRQALREAHARDPQKFSLLDPAELAPPQAYVASFAAGSTSRQWVFRGRDEEGAALEAQRAILDQERGELTRKLDRARDPDKRDAALERELAPQVEAKRKEIEAIEGQIAQRVVAFKQQLADAFPGRIDPEGSEILEASWSERSLRMALATVGTPTENERGRLRAAIARDPDLETVAVAPLEGREGIVITATWRQAPAGAPIAADDPVSRRLDQLLAPTAGAALPAIALAAHDIYDEAIKAGGTANVAIAQPYPASEHFSGQVADEMRNKALIALGVAVVAMLLYIAARFELGFGIAAIAALFHDVLLTIGLVVVFGLRIDLTVIAALLTVIGYSVNDTIVNFDRIRENMKKMPGAALADIIDQSVAQTIPRTVLTGGATILAMVFLMLFAGHEIFAFTSCLLIGTILGTYSSVFVAAPMLLLFDRRSLVTPEVPDQDPADKPAEGEPQPG